MNKETQEPVKKGRTMNLILVVLAVFLLLFIGIMLWLYYSTGGIPDTLCTCVFGVCGGECGIMGWIKTTKDKHLSRLYELEDRAERKRNRDAAGERPDAESEEDGTEAKG